MEYRKAMIIRKSKVKDTLIISQNPYNNMYFLWDNGQVLNNSWDYELLSDEFNAIEKSFNFNDLE